VRAEKVPNCCESREDNLVFVMSPTVVRAKKRILFFCQVPNVVKAEKRIYFFVRSPTVVRAEKVPNCCMSLFVVLWTHFPAHSQCSAWWKREGVGREGRKGGVGLVFKGNGEGDTMSQRDVG
jgi:hypothetical protein